MKRYFSIKIYAGKGFGKLFLFQIGINNVCRFIDY